MHLTSQLIYRYIIYNIIYYIIYSAGYAPFTSASGRNGAMGRVYIAFILLIGNSLPILVPYSVNYLVKKCCICLFANTAYIEALVLFNMLNLQCRPASCCKNNHRMAHNAGKP